MTFRGEVYGYWSHYSKATEDFDLVDPFKMPLNINVDINGRMQNALLTEKRGCDIILPRLVKR